MGAALCPTLLQLDPVGGLCSPRSEGYRTLPLKSQMTRNFIRSDHDSNSFAGFDYPVCGALLQYHLPVPAFRQH